jgi:hypothetical protein
MCEKSVKMAMTNSTPGSGSYLMKVVGILDEVNQ